MNPRGGRGGWGGESTCEPRRAAAAAAAAAGSSLTLLNLPGSVSARKDATTATRARGVRGIATKYLGDTPRASTKPSSAVQRRRREAAAGSPSAAPLLAQRVVRRSHETFAPLSSQGQTRQGGAKRQLILHVSAEPGANLGVPSTNTSTACWSLDATNSSGRAPERSSSGLDAVVVAQVKSRVREEEQQC